jgi:ABC-2 type transport system permease protein
MLLDRVPAWEVALAIVLLMGAVWILRRLAGKVFHLGMLMYGKEPSWGEVRRWMRET